MTGYPGPSPLFPGGLEELRDPGTFVPGYAGTRVPGNPGTLVPGTSLVPARASPPRQTNRQAGSGQEPQVYSGEGAPATRAPVRYQPLRLYRHAKSLPRHYTPGTVRECGRCAECLGDAWEAKEEVFRLEAEQRRLSAERLELEFKQRAVQEKLALGRAHFKL
eukprot:3941632-Rhodomonas_salina.1